MFYRLPTIRRRIKQAWKAGTLLVGLTHEGWLYVGGSAWLLVQDIKSTPKEFRAAIIELAGDLPQPGEVFRAGKDGNQMEMENLDQYLLPKLHENLDETGEDYNETGVILQWGDTMARFLKSVAGGNAAIVSDELCSIPDPDAIDKGSGETEILGPIRPMGGNNFIWHNDTTWYAAWPMTAPNQKEDPRGEELFSVARGFKCTTIGEELVE